MEKYEITTRLAEFAAATKYSDIPKEVLEFTKCLTLKTVSGMIAGSSKTSGQKLARIVQRRNLPQEVGVIGGGFKAPLWEAVFLNAFFAHASELEDDRIGGGGVSWDITVIPLLLPLAEKLKLSGKALLEALVIGLEVHTRSCLFFNENIGIDVIPGALGPAVGGARAFGLDSQKISQAMGLAMSGVPLTFLNWGTDGHCFESSMHSLQGILAAEMAKEGMTSNPDIETYLTKLIGKDYVKPEEIIKDLGKRWVLRDIWIKKYPCCFFNHRQIDALITTMKKYNLKYDDIELVQIDATPTDEICNRPNPRIESDLMFSFQNTLGAAMLSGDVNVEHFTPEALVNPQLIEARKKVKVVIHPDWHSVLLEEPAHITVKTRTGKEYSVERQYVIGAPQEPLTEDDFRGLFVKFTKHVLPEKEIKKTTEAILHLEELPDMQDLMDTLVYKRSL